jgi:plasmid stability protein
VASRAGSPVIADHQAKMIQIRHVPDALHRKLRARAALAGMSLSDFLRRDLETAAERLTSAELEARLNALPPVSPREAPAAAARAERDSR